MPQQRENFMADESLATAMDPLAQKTAKALVDAAAHAAFRLFRDKEFRRTAGFKRLSQAEQDRIFNELVAAFLILIMLLIEAPDLRPPPEARGYLGQVHGLIPKAHNEGLRALGVDPANLRLWAQLLDQRYQEYAKDRHEVRAAAMQLEGAEKPLAVDGLDDIQLLLPVQAVAIGCHHHNCRGKTDGFDEMFKCTVRALGEFYVELRVRLEGREIKPAMRLRVALKRLARRWTR
jgi:hypothetical protein